MEAYIAAILLFGFNFAPRGWALCAGQLLPIQQNAALFSLVGTQYGGNGTTTFGLPDLRGRTAIGMGQGSGTSNYVIGQAAGTENVTILTTNMPAHTHLLSASTADADATVPTNNFLAASPKTGSGPNATTLKTYASSSVATGNMTTLAPTTVASAGSNQPISIIQPYLALNYCIALQGIFPSRN